MSIDFMIDHAIDILRLYVIATRPRLTEMETLINVLPGLQDAQHLSLLQWTIAQSPHIRIMFIVFIRFHDNPTSFYSALSPIIEIRQIFTSTHFCFHFHVLLRFPLSTCPALVGRRTRMVS